MQSCDLEFLIFCVQVVSALLELTNLRVQSGHHCLPVIPQLPVALLLNMQALPQGSDVDALQAELVLLHTHARKDTQIRVHKVKHYCADAFMFH